MAPKNFGSSAARAMSRAGIFTPARRICGAASRQARWLPPRASTCCRKTGAGFGSGADGAAGAARKAGAFVRLAKIRLVLRWVVASH
jgi:hypothetical protein